MKFIVLCLFFSSSAVATCLEKTQALVDKAKYSQAYHEFEQCFDKTNHEHVFSLAVIHMRSNSKKESLHKATNKKIVFLLRKSLNEGHVKSRVLLAEIYASGKYKGIEQNKKLSRCLKDDLNKAKLFKSCFEGIKLNLHEGK